MGSLCEGGCERVRKGVSPSSGCFRFLEVEDKEGGEEGWVRGGRGGKEGDGDSGGVA